MDRPWNARRKIALNLATAVLLLCTALCMAGQFLTMPNVPLFGGPSSWDHLAQIAAETSSLLLLCAGVLILFRPRVGYSLGLAAGLISLVWLALTEVWLGSRNSWIFLNYENPEMPPWDSSDWGPVFFELRILAAAFTVIAVSCTALRLFPARWVLRGAPLCRRTWPAFAVGFFVLAAWFVHSVTPYSAPGYDHPPHAPMRILHLQKRGLRFYETTVNMFRFGQVWVQRVDRRLFQYRFQARLALSLLDGASPAYHRAQAMIQSPELWKRRTPPPRMMWSWNAEGWYVVLKDSQLLAFTTESGTKPPAEVTDLFHELEKLPTSEERSFAFRDVCLGFCYDPVAALGFSILPQRNRLLSSSTFVRSGF